MGQRPMSQRKEVMPVVVNESGAGDILLRPLCAKNLPKTKPELEGWVDREKLLAFHGRNRKPQMALAKEFGFEDYAAPAGGCCFLTDINYSAKLVDLWQARSTRDYEMDDIMLLKIGRHLRPKPYFKLIIGREEGENKFMQGYTKIYTNIKTVSHGGPLCLIDGPADKDDLEFAAQMVARYSQGKNEDAVTLLISRVGEEPYEVTVKPLSADEVKPEWHV
ncbi:MAG: tRNA (5-methylaminomethyl-2-thiouridylate)-methyltransferase, partial [Gammaproteobacteria bacterium]|nr:tRNA (5-methylaminomethyl-2-thiouridylate)-methyltransferase [Gammaproteobacteria bacterium]